MRRRWVAGALLALSCALAAAGAAGAVAARPRSMVLYDAAPYFFAPGGRTGERDASGRPVRHCHRTHLESLDCDDPALMGA
jgi:hypothetical protein